MIQMTNCVIVEFKLHKFEYLRYILTWHDISTDMKLGDT